MLITPKKAMAVLYFNEDNSNVEGFTQEEQVYDPHDVEYGNYAGSFADREKVV